ncbi:hypothetical protein PVIIG_06104 [Plasmodium vivax India VII]|uniref:Uncharacterized protein n=2 Tax=Plasmodium vivax TaxID=5855 RepID=A0A0J9T5C9_PLAVI|nr:hypothetical protein PVIIG_06104 [Plasmodium vivax India VII]KMZ89827.1 hypothetical protein PVMG_05992 [Plasmodium vivax Mauritania I]
MYKSSSFQYDIFKDIYVCDTLEAAIEEKVSKEEAADFCNDKSFVSDNGLQIRKICKEFVTYFKILHSSHKNNGEKHLSSKYTEFLNYWLKHQLEQSAIKKIGHKDLYNYINSKYISFGEDGALAHKIHDLGDNFYSMIVLYLLNKEFYKFKNNRDVKCKDFLEVFETQYNAGLKRCYFDGDSNLCIELRKFINLCNHELSQKLKDCNNLGLSSMPKLILWGKSNDIGDNYNDFNLIDFQNKCSYIEFAKIKKEKYPNLYEILAFHYNLPYKSGLDEKKRYMMTILHEFIQYCNENKINTNLSSFMREFIDYYYNKSIEDYKKIFEECKHDHNSKEHCSLYKTCKNNFNNDLSLIQNNPHNYIMQQEEYITKLSPLDFFILKAKAMFLDSAAMSKYSTTIISIMISFFLCFFFLYKVLKNYI